MRKIGNFSHYLLKKVVFPLLSPDVLLVMRKKFANFFLITSKTSAAGGRLTNVEKVRDDL
jgi:hypothetical protein